jgi:2-polyprenyl-3-methyl-5-hydroxy-6-metoxy-1,4-benzoquinol methylase
LDIVFEAHQREWAAMGEDNAWWSVLTDPRFKNLADIPEEDKDNFFASAGGEALVMKKLFELYNIPLTCTNGLDFGAGVGRLSQMMVNDLGCKHVVAVDQSLPHIKIATEEARRKGLSGRIAFNQTGVDLLKTLNGQQFDLFISFIVFQHMVPPLQEAYLEQICDAMVSVCPPCQQMSKGQAPFILI